MTPDELVEIEAVRRLKHRYVRLLDTKAWDELETLFVPEATASYSDGRYSFDDRGGIMGFLRESMSSPAMLTSHKVHQPEIDLTGPDSARGVWALDDVVVLLDHQLTIRGAAFYDDRYVKRDGEWRIAHTGYTRIYEEMEPRAADLRLTAPRELTSKPEPSANGTKRFTRDEIETAFVAWQRAGETADWSAWADQFTEDATYVEHHYGTMHGREAIRAWITETMSTFPGNQMPYFPVEWHMVDEERGWVVAYVQNRMIDPGDGSIHQSANVSILHYAGDGLWSYEEDVYNPANFAPMVAAWKQRFDELHP
jgi:uncharacterized protein (TIGR02246 family)